MSDQSLFLITLITSVLAILFSLTSKRYGLIYRLYYIIFIGLLGLTLTIIKIGFDPSLNYRNDAFHFTAIFLCCAAVMTLLAFLLSRKPFEKETSKFVKTLSSFTAVGIQFISFSIFILIGEIIALFLQGQGNRAAMREIAGTGVSRNVAFTFWSVAIPFVFLIVTIISFIMRRMIRNYISGRLLEDEPGKPHKGFIIAGSLMLMIFIIFMTASGYV
ncbi:MAG: hypothetical protein WC212_02035 [Candidatus Delongbacteria bacterium]